VDESIGKLTATESQVSQSLGEIRERGDRAIRALALLQLGEQQMEARNTQAALRVFEEAFLQDPDNRATNYFLGELYAQEGDLERAIEHIQRAQAGDFRYAPAMAAEAYILRLQGERETTGDARSRLYAQAEARFLDALATDPRALDINNQSIYGVLGGLYKRQGRLAEAIRVYREAERVTPTSSYPVNNLALLYAMQGDNAQAARYFERTAAMSEQLLQRNAADYWARFDLIAARAWLGQGQEARRQIDIALAYPTARGQIGKLRGSLTAIENTASQPDTMQSVRTYLEEALHRPMEGGADGTG
jgi:tetratricopeptide (TPR) repeat protein